MDRITTEGRCVRHNTYFTNKTELKQIDCLMVGYIISGIKRIEYQGRIIDIQAYEMFYLCAGEYNITNVANGYRPYKEVVVEYSIHDIECAEAFLNRSASLRGTGTAHRAAFTKSLEPRFDYMHIEHNHDIMLALKDICCGNMVIFERSLQIESAQKFFLLLLLHTPMTSPTIPDLLHTALHYHNNPHDR